MSNKSDQYVIYLKQSLFSLYYKRVTVANFSFGYTWPGRRTKARRPNMSPPDRKRNLDKSPQTLFCFLVLITLGRPSHHISSHTSIEVCFGRIQHNTRRQCLALCFTFSTVHEMAEFASPSNNQRHSTYDKCLSL